MEQTLIRRAFNSWRENFAARSLDENAPHPRTWREILSELQELAAPRPNQRPGRNPVKVNRLKDAVAEFATSPSLQAEFGTESCYRSWLAVADKARIVGGIVVK